MGIKDNPCCRSLKKDSSISQKFRTTKIILNLRNITDIYRGKSSFDNQATCFILNHQLPFILYEAIHLLSTPQSTA